jgi:iron complex transport system substrate-binding protein
MSKNAILVILVAVILVAGSAVGAVWFFSGNSGTGPTDHDQDLSFNVTDDRGIVVSFDKAPERIVSLGSSFTEILYDLGEGDHIVGVDYSSTYPADTANKVPLGKVGQLSPETLLNLTPDVVIFWNYSMYQSKISTLENMSVNVLAYNSPKSVHDIETLVLKLGKATGKDDQAVALVDDMDRRLQEVTNKTLTKVDKPQVYIELMSMSGQSPGNGTISNQAIQIAGGINVYGNVTGYVKHTDEYVVSVDPDIIVIEDSSTISNQDLSDRPGWSSTTAITDGKIFRIDGQTLNASPRIVEAIEQLYAWFYE